MEKNMDLILDDIMSKPNNIGCLFSNNQGLCIGARGKTSPTSSGTIVAISELACKLQPYSPTPVITLEMGDTSCIIHKYGVTGAVYKKK